VDGNLSAIFRQRLNPVVVRLQLGLWPIVQTALAARVAWVVAVLVVGYEHSSFAPVAAVLSPRRCVEPVKVICRKIEPALAPKRYLCAMSPEVSGLKLIS
jgi:hypothetical protein